MTNRLKTELIEARRAAVSPYVIEYAGDKVLDIKKGFAAVWMAEQGTPMSEIAQFLGHSDPHITYRVYARYSPQYFKKAASALEF